MNQDSSTRQNRIREALGRIYENEPPYFREYLRRFREDPSSRVFAPLAEAYRRLGRIDEAIEICREGLEHHPDFHGGRVALAKCLMDKHSYEDAKVELEKVVQSVPENLLAQRLLGDAFVALKDAPSALHCFKMALLLSPSDVVLSEKVRALEKGEISFAEPVQTEETTETTDLELGAMEAQETEAPAPETLESQDYVTLEPGVVPTEENDSENDRSIHSAQIDNLLGVKEGEGEEDGFKVAAIDAILDEVPQSSPTEITTETLGDLYYSQGQFDRALRIFEKVQSSTVPSHELTRKIQACRANLGVGRDAIRRNRQIDMLRSILKTVRKEVANSHAGR